MAKSEQGLLLPASERPRDPKSRAVVASEPRGLLGVVDLELDCGHHMRRRACLCAPTRVICTLC
jgi:hypothetical protein